MELDVVDVEDVVDGVVAFEVTADDVVDGVVAFEVTADDVLTLLLLTLVTITLTSPEPLMTTPQVDISKFYAITSVN